jgi:lipopolysaccharide biosynthesis regulator YciM
VEIWGDREVALAFLKRAPSTLETAQPKKKFDELVLLKGGSEAARAEVLEQLSQKPGLLTNMPAARKSIGASSE